MRWVQFDGYNETHLLVREDGRIMGNICGSERERDRGWYVHNEATIPSVNLGRYLNLIDAKFALSTAVQRATCPTCHGKGQIEDGDSMPCPTCKEKR